MSPRVFSLGYRLSELSIGFLAGWFGLSLAFCAGPLPAVHLNWACGLPSMLFLVLLHGRTLFFVKPTCYAVVSLSR